jgi:hypothetical protein
VEVTSKSILLETFRVLEMGKERKKGDENFEGFTIEKIPRFFALLEYKLQ